MSSPPKERPGARPTQSPRPVALHPVVPCPGGPAAGIGVPACPGGLWRLLVGSPQLGLLGPGHLVRGVPRGGPLAGGGGPQFRPRPLAMPLPPPQSWRPSWSASWQTRTLNLHLPSGGTPSALTRSEVRLCPKQSWDTRGGRLPAPWRASRRPRAPSGKSSAGWSDQRTAWAPHYAGCSMCGQRSAATSTNSARWARGMLAWNRAANTTR